jgi:hypothetical protein
MSDLVRKFPNTFIGRVTALENLQRFYKVVPMGTVHFPTEVEDMLSPAELPFVNAYYELQGKEAVMLQKLSYKTAAFDNLQLFVTSFFAVMKYAVKRSLALKDGKWKATDPAFYNLDETAGRIPLMNSDDDVKRWAELLLNGEQARLLANAAAEPMSNPSAAEVQQMLDAANLHTAPLRNASLEYNTAQTSLRKQAKQTDKLLRMAWNFLDANYSHLPMESKRNAMRLAGVIYYNTGKSTVLSVVVKDAAGKPLQGAKATLLQTGGSTTANKEGRINLKTKTDGEVQMQITYPTKQTVTVSFNITKADAGTTITAAEVVMG